MRSYEELNIEQDFTILRFQNDTENTERFEKNK